MTMAGSIIGKKVANDIYWHISINDKQPSEILKIVESAIRSIQNNINFNVIRLSKSSLNISFLRYEYFFENEFPELRESLKYYIDTASFKVTTYENSENPPILHRKELLIDNTHPDYPKFKNLTFQAEKIGLFENVLKIGNRKQWEKLIFEKGYYLKDYKFYKIENSYPIENQSIPYNNISRHLTAIARNKLSTPLQALEKIGYLSGEFSIFDYGCGRGDDLKILNENNILASGWDPFFAPEKDLIQADIVNLGFVLNVIENVQERNETLIKAYSLAKNAMVVSCMLYNQNSFNGIALSDGIVTSKGTFQKYFSQIELKEYIEGLLSKQAIPLGPGIFIIFQNGDLETDFLYKKQSTTLINADTYLKKVRIQAISKESSLELKFNEHSELIRKLWEDCLNRGRLLSKIDFKRNYVIPKNLTIPSLYQIFKKFFPMQNLHKRELIIRDNIIVTVSLFLFKQKQYSLIGLLKDDIKYFFGSESNVKKIAMNELVKIGNSDFVLNACKQSEVLGLGIFDDENNFYVHTINVNILPLILRIYINCGTLLYGNIESADLIKIHVQSGKLTLLRYDNFIEKPLPELRERVKIDFIKQKFDLFTYGDQVDIQYLFLKSKFINKQFMNYDKQLKFDSELLKLDIFQYSKYGPNKSQLERLLESNNLRIQDFEIIQK